MCESCLDKYINVVTWPPKQKIPDSAPDPHIQVEPPVHNNIRDYVQSPLHL